MLHSSQVDEKDMLARGQRGNFVRVMEIENEQG